MLRATLSAALALTASLLAPACDTSGSDGPPPDATADTLADADDTPPATPLEPLACAGDVRLDWSPAVDQPPVALPDDLWLVDDPTTATGSRVHLDGGDAPWFRDAPDLFRDVWSDVSTLDGWGTSAGITLRFSGPIESPAFPSGAATAAPDSPVQLIALGAGGPRLVPFEARFTDEGATAILWPMLPLEPGTRHGVLVRDTLQAPGGGCVARSDAMAHVLGGAPFVGAPDALPGRVSDLLDAASLTPDELSAAIVFTTQSLLEPSLAIAEAIRGRDYAWSQLPECELEAHDGGSMRRCEGRFIASDFRADGVVADGTPQSDYELVVTLWLPPGGDGPFPAAVFGHGLRDTRLAAEVTALDLTSRGIAVVATDAIAHGDHPDSPPPGSSHIELTWFFQVDLLSGRFSPRRLRDAFRQTTFDRLQLLELLADAPDLDGDGAPELTTAAGEVAYVGESFGAIMGPALLALTDRVGASVLQIGGARVVNVMSASPRFALITDLLRPDGATDGDMARMFALTQAVIEAGDPVNWSPFVLRDRRVGAPPHLASLLIVDDQTVPPWAGATLCRALGLPHVPPVRQDLPGLASAAAAPLSSNATVAAGLARTAGVVQLDRMTPLGEGAPVPTSHDFVNASKEAAVFTGHFLETWWADGAAELIDPLATLGTPEL